MSVCCGMRDAGGTGLQTLRGGPEEACRLWNLGRSRQWVCGTVVEGEPDWRGVTGAARAEGMGTTPRGEEDCTGRIWAGGGGRPNCLARSLKRWGASHRPSEEEFYLGVDAFEVPLRLEQSRQEEGCTYAPQTAERDPS